MTIETLNKALGLTTRIELLGRELTALNDPQIVVIIQTERNHYPVTLSTIGTDGNCEHSDTDLARELLDKLRERKSAELQKTTSDLEAL